MLAVEVDETGRSGPTATAEPTARADQLVVEVRAVSINRGEVIRGRAAGPGFRPGWDVADKLVSRSFLGKAVLQVQA